MRNSPSHSPSLPGADSLGTRDLKSSALDHRRDLDAPASPIAGWTWSLPGKPIQPPLVLAVVLERNLRTLEGGAFDHP